MWAAVVTLWMTALNWRWSEHSCLNSEERFQRSLGAQEVQPLHTHLVDPPSAVQAHPPDSLPKLQSTPESPYAKRLLYYSSQIESVDSNFSRHSEAKENCTVVLLTYKRTSSLQKVLNHYCKIPIVQRIVVVWNDVTEDIPSPIRAWTSRCMANLIFVKSRKNKLTNRYKPRKEIETDCKLLFLS